MRGKPPSSSHTRQRSFEAAEALSVARGRNAILRRQLAAGRRERPARRDDDAFGSTPLIPAWRPHRDRSGRPSTQEHHRSTCERFPEASPAVRPGSSRNEPGPCPHSGLKAPAGALAGANVDQPAAAPPGEAP